MDVVYFNRSATTLFGYTDGVVDTQSPEGKAFGDRRLAAILGDPPPSASGLMQRVIRNLNSHSMGTEAYDDLTMLILRREG